jgi:kynureninase
LFFITEQNEACIRIEDILEILKQQGHSIALVLMSGLQFYTGQLFDMETITHAAQQYVINPSFFFSKFCFFSVH